MSDAADPPIVPAPWRLRYDGVILLLAARSRRAAAPGLAGWLSAVALLDYAESPVGPYRELLYVPRVLRLPGATGPTVAGIWVTSLASARSGNANWGLTKSVISVDRDEPQPGFQRWIATGGDDALADVTHRPFGPPLPFVKPSWLGRLVQARGGLVYDTPVSAAAVMRPTRITHASLHPELVRDLSRHRILAAVALTRGRMHFGEPCITAAGARAHA